MITTKESYLLLLKFRRNLPISLYYCWNRQNLCSSTHVSSSSNRLKTRSPRPSSKDQQSSNTQRTEHESGFPACSSSSASSSSTDTGSSGTVKKFRGYEEICNIRRDQARRTLLFDVGSQHDEHTLKRSIVNVTGSRIVSSHFYEKCFLVELESARDVEQLMSLGAKHFNNKQIVPVRTRHLYFLARHGGSGNSSAGTQHTQQSTKDKLDNALLSGRSISEQMQSFCKALEQSEVGIRIRYFLASLMEDMLRSLFPKIHCRPFGSSVNGFGTDSSDLDIDIVLDSEQKDAERTGDRAFLFRTRRRLDMDRLHVQSALEIMALLLARFFPAVKDVEPILEARVPIVKFHHMQLNIGCDLSICNPGGCEMSELLWTYSQTDPRVRPLIFAIRHWARNMQIWRGDPGRWFSNIQMIALTLFYLQNAAPVEILPCVRDMLLPNASPIDGNTSKPSWSLRQDIYRLRAQAARNKQSLQDLLFGFFDFYAKFNFDASAISLEAGKSFPKPEHRPAFVANPIEIGHNICKNLSQPYLDEFQWYCREAVWMLEASEHRHLLLQPPSSSSNRGRSPWGLMVLFDKSKYRKPEVTATATGAHFVKTSDKLSAKDSYQTERGGRTLQRGGESDALVNTLIADALDQSSDSNAQIPKNPDLRVTKRSKQEAVPGPAPPAHLPPQPSADIQLHGSLHSNASSLLDGGEQEASSSTVKPSRDWTSNIAPEDIDGQSGVDGQDRKHGFKSSTQSISSRAMDRKVEALEARETEGISSAKT